MYSLVSKECIKLADEVHEAIQKIRNFLSELEAEKDDLQTFEAPKLLTLYCTTLLSTCAYCIFLSKAYITAYIHITRSDVGSLRTAGFIHSLIHPFKKYLLGACMSLAYF